MIVVNAVPLARVTFLLAAALASSVFRRRDNDLIQVASPLEMLRAWPGATVVVAPTCFPGRAECDAWLSVIEEGRARYPQVPVYPVRPLWTHLALACHTCTFRLGQARTHLPLSVKEAEDEATWGPILQEHARLRPVQAFLENVRLLSPPTAERPLLEQLAMHAHLSSIKEVVAALELGMMPGSARRKLWQQCVQQYGHSPETLLHTLRLFLFVHLRDARWTLAEMAEYLGYADVRAMSRAFKTRYGYPAQTIAQLPTRTLTGTVRDVLENRTSKLELVLAPPRPRGDIARAASSAA